MLYDITYNYGLMNPVTVEAEDAIEAAKLGVAIYRKNSTIPDKFKAKFVIKSIVLSAKKTVTPW